MALICAAERGFYLNIPQLNPAPDAGRRAADDLLDTLTTDLERLLLIYQGVQRIAQGNSLYDDILEGRDVAEAQLEMANRGLAEALERLRQRQAAARQFHVGSGPCPCCGRYQAAS